MSFDLQSLIDKLNPVCRKGLEEAAELCLAQTHFNVEIEHFLLKLLDSRNSDVSGLLRYYDVKTADLSRELTRSIDTFKRGNNRTPALTPHVLRLLEQAWLLSSLYLRADLIRSGSILLALLDNDMLRAAILDSAPSLKQIPRDSIKYDIVEIIRTSSETKSSIVKADPDFESSEPAPVSATPALDQYTIDLTARAKRGQIDPIRGRDVEIRRLIDILTRRRQNNPILTGEAGVGKTAVAEGFALRVASGDVPPPLKNVSVMLLDLALLQAGAGIKGEFEKRLKSVINEVKGATKPIILFIDEAHTMIGAGGPAGMGDAANLLKPALARGELRTIAATTWSEYKKYFEKDPALARRFQVVKIQEPDEEQAVEMLRGVAASMEKHHNVSILDEAVRDAVRLSQRYISGRQLPDKAIGVLDTACARVAIAQNSTPPVIENTAHRIGTLKLEISVLTKECVAGADHKERLTSLKQELEKSEAWLADLQQRWSNEIEAVRQVIKLEKRLRELADPSEEGNEREMQIVGERLVKERANLNLATKGAPMVHTCVDSKTIASVVSDWTGIPVGKMLTDEISKVLDLKDMMGRRIIGQSKSLDVICRRIRTFRANLDDPGKPVGVFLLVGPSGVGKTETALTLAEALYGGSSKLVTINMSEYQEAYTVSGLKGAPPGYVGHGKGGVLTEAIRHNPYSLVLLDEVEKAHPDVMELFYQVFDKGMLEDSEGAMVDFKNSVILLTSNVGSETILKACKDHQNLPDIHDLAEKIRPELLNHFKPAFLGRLVIVPFYPLQDKVIRSIVRLQLEKIRRRFWDNHKANLTYSNKLVAAIAARCTEVDTGARNVDHILTQIILPELSGELLKRMAVGEITTDVYIYLDSAGRFAYRFEPPTTSAGQAKQKPREAPTKDELLKGHAGERTVKPRPNELRPYVGPAIGMPVPKKQKSWLDVFKK